MLASFALTPGSCTAATAASLSVADHLRRRAGRREQGVPGVRLVAGQPRLRRSSAGPASRVSARPWSPPGRAACLPDVLGRGGEVVEHDRYMAAHHIDQGRARAFVGDMHHVDARHRLEQLAREVQRRPVAGGGVAVLRRAPPSGARSAPARSWPASQGYHEHIGHDHQQRDRREVLDRVVGHLLVQGRVDRSGSQPCPSGSCSRRDRPWRRRPTDIATRPAACCRRPPAGPAPGSSSRRRRAPPDRSSRRPGTGTTRVTGRSGKARLAPPARWPPWRGGHAGDPERARFVAWAPPTAAAPVARACAVVPGLIAEREPLRTVAGEAGGRRRRFAGRAAGAGGAAAARPLRQ